MIYKIEGKIFKILEALKGAKKDGGEWVKQEFVVETSGDNPEKVAFFQWEELINTKEGDVVSINFSIKTREWNGKWFTNLLVEDMSLLTSSETPLENFKEPDFEMPDPDLPF